jgi:hypothetical protein
MPLLLVLSGIPLGVGLTVIVLGKRTCPLHAAPRSGARPTETAAVVVWVVPAPVVQPPVETFRQIPDRLIKAGEQ